jgi:hypothetical protein
MLTKNDLNQISVLLDSKLDEKLDEKLKPIKKDLKSLKRIQNEMLVTLDGEQMQQRKRIFRLEEHVGFAS